MYCIMSTIIHSFRKINCNHMRKIDGYVYKGLDGKVYAIYPVSEEHFEGKKSVDYIIAEAKFMQRVGTLTEAEDDLLIFIELQGNNEKE